ncbi:MAG: hypothetical protein WBM35_00145 [Candidatus Electrothrix sp.]
MNASSVISIRDEGALDLIRSLLKQGVSVRIRVSGNSMQPFLNGGEIIEIASPAVQPPKIGDIVLFRDRQGNPLVHRLLRRRYYNGVLHLQAKGDARTGFDSPVPVDQVLGVVRRIIFTDRKIADLQASLMRLKGSCIAIRSVFFYYLIRVIFFFKTIARSLIRRSTL